MKIKGYVIQLIAISCYAYVANAQVQNACNFILQDSVYLSVNDYSLTNYNFFDIQFIDNSFYALTNESELLVYNDTGKLEKRWPINWDPAFHDGNKKFNPKQFFITNNAIYFFNHHAVIVATHDLKERYFFMLSFSDSTETFEFCNNPVIYHSYAITDSVIISCIGYSDKDISYAFDPAYYARMPLFAIYPLPSLATARIWATKTTVYPLNFAAGYSMLYQQPKSLPHLSDPSWAFNSKEKQLLLLEAAASIIKVYSLAGSLVDSIPIDTTGEHDTNPMTYLEYKQLDTTSHGYGLHTSMLNSRISSILYHNAITGLLITQRTIPVPDALEMVTKIEQDYELPFAIANLKRNQEKIISIYNGKQKQCSFSVTGLYQVIGIDNEGYLLVINGKPSSRLYIYRYALPKF